MVGGWLRSILANLKFGPDQVKDLGTHSCKCTMLSQAAKLGISVSDRRVLGYHVRIGWFTATAGAPLPNLRES